MSKQQKYFCKIHHYLEVKHPNLADLYKSACLINALMGKGVAGITLLVPDDKLTDKLKNLIMSEKEEDVNKGVNLLKSLILIGDYKSADMIKKQADDIPNRNGMKVLIDEKATGGNTIVFQSKGKAELDPSYKTFDAGKNSNVYLLSGEFPSVGDASSFKYDNLVKKKVQKKGSNQYSNGGHTGGYGDRDLSNRQRIVTAALSIYAAEVTIPRFKERKHCCHSELLDCTLSLLSFISMTDSSLLTRILPVIALRDVDFLILAEPYYRGPNPLIPDNIFEAWCQRDRSIVCNCKKTFDDIYTAINTATINNASGAIFDTARRASLFNAVRKLGSKLRMATSATLDNTISEVYQNLSVNNSFEGVDGVYPDDLAYLYRDEPQRKRCEDELRYLLTYHLAANMASFQCDMHKLLDIVRMYQEGGPRMVTVKNVSLIVNEVPFLNICLFVSSTDFIYFPVPESFLSGGNMAVTIDSVLSDTEKVWNIQGCIYKHLKNVMALQDKGKQERDEADKALLQNLMVAEGISVDIATKVIAGFCAKRH